MIKELLEARMVYKGNLREFMSNLSWILLGRNRTCSRANFSDLR
nr:MAG TPA: hypothetical protein [Caudoviricetes sp.]